VIALIARAQALGIALDPSAESVSIGARAESIGFDDDTSTVYRARIAGVVGEGKSHEAALEDLIVDLRKTAERQRFNLSSQVGSAASPDALCFSLVTLLGDEFDQTIRVEQKHWPMGSPPTYYAIYADGVRHNSWAGETLADAWQAAANGLRAIATVRAAHLAQALAADDKAARAEVER
jgi:hypothetical protein